jgi:hypothetical protein
MSITALTRDTFDVTATLRARLGEQMTRHG